ncbi:MAG: gamma carbonic anhydrase family protein [Actinomycetes bacterium]
MPVYAYEGKRPQVAADAYVHPDAVLIGDVRIGPEASVWPGAVLRGDCGHISVGARTSVQDGTVVHTTEEWPTVIGEDCVVGHNAHLEGCIVESRCLVASMSTVLNRCRIGSYSIVGAGAVVTEGTTVPERSLVVGVPARVRPLSGDAHIRRIEVGVAHYVDAARRHAKGLQAVDLSECRP